MLISGTALLYWQGTEIEYQNSIVLARSFANAGQFVSLPPLIFVRKYPAAIITAVSFCKFKASLT
jgi:hypothetical protein